MIRNLTIIISLSLILTNWIFHLYLSAILKHGSRIISELLVHPRLITSFFIYIYIHKYEINLFDRRVNTQHTKYFKMLL